MREVVEEREDLVVVAGAGVLAFNVAAAAAAAADDRVHHQEEDPSSHNPEVVAEEGLRVRLSNLLQTSDGQLRVPEVRLLPAASAPELVLGLVRASVVVVEASNDR